MDPNSRILAAILQRPRIQILIFPRHLRARSDSEFVPSLVYLPNDHVDVIYSCAVLRWGSDYNPSQGFTDLTKSLVLCDTQR